MLYQNPKREPQQGEVTMNQNRKRQTELNITGKKARKLNKKRAKIEKLQKIPDRTSQKENLQNGSFTKISEPRPMAFNRDKAI
jgi:hypothetical protein